MGNALAGPLAGGGCQVPQPLLGRKMQKKVPISRGKSLRQLPLLLNSLENSLLQHKNHAGGAGAAPALRSSGGESRVVGEMEAIASDICPGTAVDAGSPRGGPSGSH